MVCDTIVHMISGACVGEIMVGVDASRKWETIARSPLGRDGRAIKPFERSTSLCCEWCINSM